MKQLTIAVRKNNCNNLDSLKIIDKIKNSGFKSIFIEWYNNDLKMQQKQLDYAKKLGLSIAFVHLGYQNSNALWKDNEEGKKEVQRYIEDLTQCSKNDINMVIMHVTKGYDNPSPNQIGLNNIQKIVDYAATLNIKVAIENLELKGYLEFLVKNIKNKNFGICFDAGHCHAFFNDEFNFALFKNRIFAIHLHDNDKTSDQHRLPFDGTINWDKTVKHILSSNYDGNITLEVGYDCYYSKIVSINEFYNKAYDIGLELSDMFDNEKKSHT